MNIDDRNYRKIDKIYVHKNYNSSKDFDISILEFGEPIKFSRTIYPAILPQNSLNLHNESLHLASGHYDIGTWTSSIRRVNISIWSNDECVPKMNNKNVTTNKLGCIEGRYPKDGTFFDDCLVKCPIKNRFKIIIYS